MNRIISTALCLICVLAVTVTAADNADIPPIRHSQPASPAVHPDDIYWAEGPPVQGIDGEVFAMVEYNSLLIVGGKFTVAGDVIANGIAAWDGVSWSALGTGFAGDDSDPNVEISSLAVYDGKLIAGGRFKEAGGVPANHIAAWDGSSWAQLGTGASGYFVEALAVFEGKLIAGGWFDEMDGIPVGKIAAWDGAAWDSLGSGMDNHVYAITTFDDKLIAGGRFGTAGGTATANIAAWNGSSWAPVGSGTEDEIHALTVFGSELVAGGEFTVAGGIAASHIASWNGASWDSIGPGVGMNVEALAVYDGELVAGGDSGDTRISAWDGFVWEPLCADPPYNIQALSVYDGLLIAGGMLGSTDGVLLNGIGSWDGVAWSPLGIGSDGVINAMIVYNDLLIAGGRFNTIDGVLANNIAAWNGSAWTPLGSGINGDVNAFTIQYGRLIVGGEFTLAGGVSAENVAAWDGAVWYPLGTGNYPVMALAVYGNRLIAGTELQLSYSPGISVRITSWDYMSWTILDYLVEDSSSQTSIDALIVYDNQLIAAGTFDHIGSVDAHSIAAWDGMAWAPLDMSFQILYDLCLYDGNLIAGGFWGTLYSWNGTTWTNLWPWEDGWFDSFKSLTEYNGRLIASGQITPALDSLGTWITAWDGSTWAPLGSGLNDYARAMCVYDDNLMAGGRFTTAGDKVSAYFACWDENQTTSVELEPSPPALQLSQNHPNPFNPVTTISFTVPSRSHVTLSIYSPSGQLVRTLIDGTLPAGTRDEIWDGTNDSGSPVSSGVYFYRLEAGKAVMSKKMVLLR